MSKRILVVAHDRMLNATRVGILRMQGYSVVSVPSDDDAIAALQDQSFDLVLIGRRSNVSVPGVDERIRLRWPDLLILKIENNPSDRRAFASRQVGGRPEHLVRTLKELLGE